MDLTDIYRTFHPKPAEYTFFSHADGIFSSIGHMLGHAKKKKTNCQQFKRVLIVLSVLFWSQLYEITNQLWKEILINLKSDSPRRKEYPNKQNKKLKRKINNWYHRDMKVIREYYSLCQHIG